MLRKLIALVITTTVAKKAWDKYHEKQNAQETADRARAAEPLSKGAKRKSARRKGEGPAA